MQSEPFGELVTFNDEYHPDYPPMVVGMPHAEGYPKRSRKRGPRVGSRRRRLLAEDPHCHYCRCELDSESSTVDHKHPLSKGGSNEDSNTVLACYECNQLKSDTEYELFKSRKEAL